MRARLVLFAWLVFAACSPGSAAAPTARDASVDATPARPFPGFDIYVTPANEPLVKSFFEFLPQVRVAILPTANPVQTAMLEPFSDNHVRVALDTDLACGECESITTERYDTPSGAWVYAAEGGNALGAQYALAELLEAFGFRFFHPWQSKIPATLADLQDFATPAGIDTPEMTLRGLHLHTLHPIEGYFTFWASNVVNGGGSPDAGTSGFGLDGAKRVIDWIVKNRGNYVEWSALQDIESYSNENLAAWQSHTSAILTYAHSRGIKVGIGVELFGESNLQNAFDLLDNENDPNAKASVDARYHLLLDGLPWDIVDLSFGEFSGTDPTVFLAGVNLAYAELQAVAPGTEMSATIHDGNYPNLEVTYDGKTMLYYFLVQYANPAIVPWLHTVMYFDLFQPADGAYDMPNFDQHRAYIEQRLMAGQPVGYYPESAYWIAFDDSVPTYLPLYIRSRWLDQSSLNAASAAGGYGQLEQSVLFSSGWEWGYWQTDYATLRMNWKTPNAWTDPVNDMFAPWGSVGAQLAKEIGALGELQNTYLIVDALAAYVAGQDEIVLLGALGNTPSQPDRVSFADYAAMSASDRQTFATKVLAPLAKLDSETTSIKVSIDALHLDPTDPWLTEVADGVAIDADRARFVHSLYEAVASFESSGTDGGWLARADAAFSDAGTVVARRDAALHYPNPSQLLGPGDNSTIYQSGYLTEAATLCYWTRERIEADEVIMNKTIAEPDCVP